MQRTAILVLLLASVMAGVGQFLFKLGAHGRVEWKDFLNVHILGGFTLYGLGSVLWVYAMSSERLTTVYPFTALTFAIVFFLGWVVLGEPVSVTSGVGVFLILVGLALIINA